MNKKIISLILITVLTVQMETILNVNSSATSSEPTQMEYLDRGVIAVKSGSGVYLSWRLLGTENYDTAFDVYRGNEKIATVSDSTNYIDTSIGTEYTVAVSGEPMSSGDTVTVWDNQYLEIPLDVPEGGTSLDGEEYTYSPNDVTPADVDGDGEYELILKWEPSNSFDSGQAAKYNGNVYIDCYKLSGEKLWRIDMGININAGAHFTQMAAYDFDLDGKAEMTLKTAPGTKDGNGNYVSEASLISEIKNTDNTADYRHSEYGISDTAGRVMSGDEYYTVFQGDTGAALDTVYYPHPRGTVSEWGDTWGNRSERFLAAVAYLDGHTPSMITWRGYYAKTTATAYNLVNKRLVQIADFDTSEGDNYRYAGNGNHNLTVGDVDNDGCDEILCGSLCLDNDLSVLWCSGRGHGDALHLADYDPTHDGLEYFSVHEEYVKDNETDEQHMIFGSTTGNDGKIRNGGMTLYDAANGAELFHVDGYGDTGRGMMANTGYSNGYFDIWGSGNYTSYGGDKVEYGSFTPQSTNFRIFWDGDMYDELLDGVSSHDCNIAIYSKHDRLITMTNTLTNNYTKNNPCLTADLFGDWREEVVARSDDNASLYIYTTTIPTENKLYTLMHDRTYRMQIACQNAGYNQPPHIGYYVNDDNNGEDSREYAAYIKTVHNGEMALRTQNKPGDNPSPKPTPTATPKVFNTQAPEPDEYETVENYIMVYNGKAINWIIPDHINGYEIQGIIQGVLNDVNRVIIETIIIPDTVIEIGREVFKGCISLKTVKLPLFLDTINPMLFYGDTALTAVIMPETLTRIREKAFSGCTALEALYIPETVSVIADNAFEDCDKLVLEVKAGSYAEEYAKSHNISYITYGAPDPTAEPTPTPTAVPMAEPTPAPTAAPTTVPTAEPTPTPTIAPTIPPTETPLSPTDGYTYEYRIKSHSEDSGVIEIEVECYKKSNASMIFAEYDDGGRLKRAELRDISDKSGRFSESFHCTSGFFKVFIWDMDTLIPYSCVYMS